MGLGQYNSLGKYCGPHTASSVFLILICILDINEDISGQCFMFLQLFRELLFLSVKQIFEMYPRQNVLRYLPQCDQKVPSGI